jgi:hypothetical protein
MKNRTYLILIGLALLGVYLYRNRKKPTPIIQPNLPPQNEVNSQDNPVNTDTEELIGVTTNPTEVTDFTADQTTTCYTGCPQPSAISVINGSCEENNLYSVAPMCANMAQSENIGGNILNSSLDSENLGSTLDTPLETEFLGNAPSGLNKNSGVGCGVIGKTAEEVINTHTQTQVTNVVSSSGLEDNLVPSENILDETKNNQEALGVFDFNSGFANAYDIETIVSPSSLPTRSNAGLPTRNTRV